MREDKTEEQKDDHKSFNDLDLGVTHFHVYHMLLIRSESLCRAHVQEKGMALYL